MRDVAPPAPRNADFRKKLRALLDQYDASPRANLGAGDCGKEARCASPNDHKFRIVHSSHLTPTPPRSLDRKYIVTLHEPWPGTPPSGGSPFVPQPISASLPPRPVHGPNACEPRKKTLHEPPALRATTSHENVWGFAGVRACMLYSAYCIHFRGNRPLTLPQRFSCPLLISAAFIKVEHDRR
jgi:hypothetical protein